MTNWTLRSNQTLLYFQRMYLLNGNSYTENHPKRHILALIKCNSHFDSKTYQFVSRLIIRHPLKHTSKSRFGSKLPFSEKCRNYFPKWLVIASINVFSPNFTQIGRWKWHFGGIVSLTKGEKFGFSWPFWPPLTEGAQSFHGCVPYELPSLCKISSRSAQDCRSYSQENYFGRSQYMQKLSSSLLLYTISVSWWR